MNPRKKPCDHAPLMNNLETQLRSKENEYNNQNEMMHREFKAEDK